MTAGAVAFDCGATDGTANARLFNLGCLNNRWNYARMLVCDNGFMSVFLDWYKSNGSELFEGNSRRDIKGASVISKNSARLMGGSNYLPLTNGKYNPLYEVMYITVSGEMHDIMPVIPNPPSRFRAETGKLIYSTRSYPLTGYADDVENEIKFWKKMNAYGATDFFVRYHSALLRTPLWSQHIALQLEGSIPNGGYPAVRKLSEEVRKYVKRLGFYDDNRVLTFFSKHFDYSKLAMNSNSIFLPGYDGTFRPKSSVQLELQRKHVPELRKLYPALNAQYLDELSNAPPWADVDFDVRNPGAGKFSAVVRDYGLVALQQKELFDGPIWSEGCAGYFWAGLLDVDYGQNNQRGVIPIVDFKLKRINPLTTYTGLTLGDLIKGDVNYVITYQIAFANSGHLAQSGDGNLPYQGKLKNLKNIRPVLKSYFMMRQLQEYYSGQIPVEIKYFINGKFMTASEMLKGNHTNSGKIYIKYPNDLEIWCNLNPKESWTVNVDGEEYVLPVNGHAACIPDVLLQYSAIIDGHRADYSRGALYTYLDGCGQMTKFPEVAAANAYLLTSQQKSIKLTPVPFVAAETLKGLAALTAQPLTENGTPAGSKMTLDIIDEGQANIAIDGKAFSYILQ